MIPCHSNLNGLFFFFGEERDCCALSMRSRTSRALFAHGRAGHRCSRPRVFHELVECKCAKNVLRRTRCKIVDTVKAIFAVFLTDDVAMLNTVIAPDSTLTAS
jgi:hypothetical protein